MAMLQPPKAPARGMLVSEAARRCRLTPRAIRFYEERGLVRSERGPAGQRQFDHDMLERLSFIGRARKLGLSLSDVKALLELGDRNGPEAQRESLGRTCERLLSEIDQRRRHIEGVLHALAKEGRSPQLRAAV